MKPLRAALLLLVLAATHSKARDLLEADSSTSSWPLCYSEPYDDQHECSLNMAAFFAPNVWSGKKTPNAQAIVAAKLLAARVLCSNYTTSEECSQKPYCWWINQLSGTTYYCDGNPFPSRLASCDGTQPRCLGYFNDTTACTRDPHCQALDVKMITDTLGTMQDYFRGVMGVFAFMVGIDGSTDDVVPTSGTLCAPKDLNTVNTTVGIVYTQLAEEVGQRGCCPVTDFFRALEGCAYYGASAKSKRECEALNPLCQMTEDWDGNPVCGLPFTELGPDPMADKSNFMYQRITPHFAGLLLGSKAKTAAQQLLKKCAKRSGDPAGCSALTFKGPGRAKLEAVALLPLEYTNTCPRG